MAKTTALSTVQIIDAKIASITKRGAALRADCQSCLVMIIDHAGEHGDYDRLPKLFEAIKGALGSSMSQAAINWVNQFVDNLKWSDEERKFVKIPKAKIAIKDVENYNIPGDEKPFTGNARHINFWQLERQVAQKPFNLQEAIKLVLVRAERERDKQLKETGHSSVTKAQVEALKSLSEHIDAYKDEQPAMQEQPVEQAPNQDEGKNAGVKAA